MSLRDIQTLVQLSKSSTPEGTRDVILRLGFNGLLFQRWYSDIMDNWEGFLKKGFLQHYYGTQLYKSCAVANSVHTWRRDYAFNEARAETDETNLDAIRVNSLYRQFDMDDGLVLLTGSNARRSAVFLTTKGSAEGLLDSMGPILSYAARQLTLQLPENHKLLTKISRGDPKMSPLQEKIMQMQIDYCQRRRKSRPVGRSKSRPI